VVKARLTWKHLLFGIAGLAALGAIVIYSGLVTVSARPPHTEATRYLLHTVFKSSVARRAASIDAAPDLTDPGLIALGARHYGEVCSSCHGGPGLGQSPQALAMRPRPQSLPAVVGQFSDAELFVILRDGVRFSAMPSWPADGNFDEIWPVVAFLRQLPGMSPEDYVKATSVDLGQPDAAPAELAWQDRGTPEDVALHEKAPPLDEYLYSVPSTGWRPIGLDGAPLAHCEACHGKDGTGAPTGGQAPNIAILSRQAIAQRLRDYASGRRQSGIMAVMASSLSEPQIDALAEHFAALPDKSLAASAPPKGGEGGAIVHDGLFARALPACATCHNAKAEGSALDVPPLAGQNAAFLLRRLNGFAEGDGPDRAGWNPMHDIAAGLSPEERSAVATYLAALPPSEPLAPHDDWQVAESTAEKAQRCASCHDATDHPKGALSPNLTLQSSDYIEHQLELFAADKRPIETMREAAHELSQAEMKELSAYFGRETAKPSAGTVPASQNADPAARAKAQDLAEHGNSDRGIPACSSCHGAAPTRAVSLIPRLDGQKADYLEQRLDYFAENDTKAVLAPMPKIAARLTGSERAALANWFAGQQPLTK